MKSFALLPSLLFVSLSSKTRAFGIRSTTTSATSSFALFAKPKVFIDGEAGTTGLQVRERLAKRDDLEILSIDNDLRKDEAERKKLINQADAVILCT